MKKILLRSERGMAMPELLVAISIILIVLTSSAFVIVNGLRTQTDNEDRDVAVQLVRDEIEKARALGFGDLQLDSDAFSDGQVDINAITSDVAEREKGNDSYEKKPLVDPVIGSDGLAPWASVLRGEDINKDIPGLTYYVRTDINHYSGESDTGYRSKEVTVTAYWENGKGESDSTSMSWIRTPSLSEAEPSGTETDDKVELNNPTDISYIYNAMGTKLDVSWYFSQSEISEAHLSFEVFLGTPSDMEHVRTEPGIARKSTQIAIDGATHMFVRAVYRNETADSVTVSLSEPTVVTAPDAPEITSRQVPGTTTAEFSFDAVNRASNYTARYRINDGAWSTIGNMTPGSRWASPEVPAGGTVEFGVFASNIAGSSDMSTSSVNILGRPATPAIGETKQDMMDAIFKFSSADRADSYNAQYRLNDGNWQNLSGSDVRANREIVIDGVEPGNIVHFRVSSFSNISGSSDYATANHEIVPPPPEPEIYVSEQQPGKAVFGFERAYNADSYQAAWRIGNSGNWNEVSNPEPGEDIEVSWDHGSDQTINFRVRSYNGISGYSDYTTTHVDMKTPPTAPVISSASQNKDEARFSFNSVNRVDSYLVEARVGAEGDWDVRQDASPNSTIKVKGSGAHGEVISLRVTALNSTYGNSPRTSDSVTMVGIPYSPNIKSSEQVDRDAVFVFDPVPNATDYRVRYQVGSSGTWKTYSNPAPSTNITIPGNGIMNELVSVEIYASNIAGESQASEASLNLVGRPLSPEITTAEQRLMKVYFAFEESAGAEYYHGQYRVNSGQWVTINEENLIPGEEIEIPVSSTGKVDFRISASNDAGESGNATETVNVVVAPGVPNIVKAEQDKESAIFRYQNVSGATSYEAQYRVNDGAWTTTNTSPNTDFKTTNTTFGDKVEFRVRTLNVAGNSNYSTATVNLINVPSSPVWTQNYQSGTDAIFKFSPASRADSYLVQKSVNGGAWTAISYNTPNAQIVVPANANDEVELRVYARNIAGSSTGSYTSVDIVAPPAMPDFDFAVQLGASEVNYEFSGSARAENYQVQYRVNGTGNWITEGNDVQPDTDHVISGFSSGDSVHIRVRAQNAAGYSGFASKTVNMVGVPNSPTWSVSEQVDGSKAKFAFNSVQDAENYTVQYRENNGSWQAVSPQRQPGIVFEVPGSPGMKLDLRVRASNVVGDSGWRETTVNFAEIPAQPTWNYYQQVNKTTARFKFSSVVNTDEYVTRYKVNGANYQDHSETRPNRNINVNASDGDTVYAAVMACNVSGCSSYSYATPVKMDTVPNRPTFNYASTNYQNTGIARFRFGSVPGADNYITRDKRFPGGFSGDITRTPNTMYSFDSGAGGHKIQMAARACNLAGCSSWGYSDEVITTVNVTGNMDYPTVRAIQWWLSESGYNPGHSNYRWNNNTATHMAFQLFLRARGQSSVVGADGDWGYYSNVGLQQYLDARGYYAGGAVDGDLGPFTVKGLQRIMNDRNFN